MRLTVALEKELTFQALIFQPGSFSDSFAAALSIILPRGSGGGVMERAVTVPRAKRVFVVDDEFVIATTLALILRKQGFDASAYTSAKSVLETALVLAPDLLISDVAMPGLSGISLAMLIKDRYPQCKVLLFSGQAETADLLMQARRRGHDFLLLAKPVHPSDLLSRIRAFFPDARPALEQYKYRRISSVAN